MNKSLILKVENAARKHEKSGSNRSRNCFKTGAEFCDKNSKKQYTKEDMYQMLFDGVANFANKNNLKIKESEIKSWFKNYINK